MPGLYCRGGGGVSVMPHAGLRLIASGRDGETYAVRLLDTTGLRRRLAGGLGGELLARGLATGGLAGGLLWERWRN